jgi:hypothetical protein
MVAGRSCPCTNYDGTGTELGGPLQLSSAQSTRRAAGAASRTVESEMRGKRRATPGNDNEANEHQRRPGLVDGRRRLLLPDDDLLLLPLAIHRIEWALSVCNLEISRD